MTFFGPDIRNGLPIGLGSVAGFGRRAFTPSVLFAAGEQGFWYDPSDLSSMYQDSAGTTPVTAVEQAVGLIFDKSKGLVLGPELVTNGGPFTATTGWAGENATLSVVSGKLRVTSSAAGFASAYQTLSGLVANGWYVVAATVQRISGSGTAYVRFYDTAPTTTPIAGPFFSSTTAAASGAAYFQASADGQITLNLAIASAAAANETADFNLVSVRAVPGNHAIQPGATNRPILRSRYNLLTYSEQFDNAAWTKTRASVTADNAVAPDGTTTAEKLVEDATASNTHFVVVQAALTVTSPAVTYSIYLKAAERTRAQVNISDNVSGDLRLDVNLSNGTFTTSSSGTWSGFTAGVELVGNGWYRCFVSGTKANNPALPRVFLADANGNTTYTGDGTSGIWIWGAQLLIGADATALSNRYQRIAAATDYDTVGFPVYLAFDGSDDSLYTGGNVDFSATDKMTVWAGVTKLSDGSAGTYGCIAELGTDINSVNGTWALFGPAAAPGGTPDFGMSSRGTLTANAIASSNAAPITRVMTGEGQIGGLPFVTLRLDGTQAASGVNSQGTGNFGSYPLYIGRRNNATLPFNGRLYQLIGRGAATSAALITQAERWVAGKQGRAL